jgi:hypothetical protein
MNGKDLGLLFGGFVIGAAVGFMFREKRQMNEVTPKEFFDLAKKSGGEASVNMKFTPSQSETIQKPQPQMSPFQFDTAQQQPNIHQNPFESTKQPQMPKFQFDLTEEDKARLANDLARSLYDIKKKRENGEELTKNELAILDINEKRIGMLKNMIASLEDMLANTSISSLSKNESSTYRTLKEQKKYGVKLSEIEEKALSLLEEANTRRMQAQQENK